MGRFVRLIAVVVAVLAGAVSGCSPCSHTRDPAPPLSRPDVAQVSTARAGKVVYWPRVATVDGRTITPETTTVEVAPGRRQLEVDVTWSNGFVDRTAFAIHAQSGHRYSVVARETPHFHQDVGEVLYDSTGRSVFGLFLVPFEIAKHASPKKPPQRRPLNRCSLTVLDTTTGQPAAAAVASR